MTKNPDYHKATNMAYAILIALGISSLPIRVLDIIERSPLLRAIPYTQVCTRHGLSWEEYMALNVSERGFIFRKGKRAIIFYNDTIDPEIIRFTLAHELAHFLLGHTEETPRNDKEANCFARNLLCPVPVTNRLALNAISDCCKIYAVSPPAAEVVLDKRGLDFYHITESNYNDIVQLFDLEHLTKETQLNRYSVQTASAFFDFAPPEEHMSLAI